MLNIAIEEASKYGDRLSAISVDRLADVKADFDRIGVDTSPYYTFDKPTDLGFEVRSVLVVASPSPATYASFDTKDGVKKILIPPIYLGFGKSDAAICKYLGDKLSKSGLHISHTNKLPCKAIAVHAGLGEYGRNNIVYVDGMGSFHKLTLLYSDIPCDYEQFSPLRRMDCCADCGKCTDSCITGALTADRDTVDADRCITMFNERTDDFPDWIAHEWHNALIGCVNCQYACPQNKVYLSAETEIAHFGIEQTEAFINGKSSGDFLNQLGIDDWYTEFLPRNLAVLLNRKD